MTTFIYDDGGRAAAGFRGEAGDCVCRAIAVATGRSYDAVYELLNMEGAREWPSKHQNRSSARNGVSKATTRKVMAEFGWIWQPTMQIGSGCRVHLRSQELPSGPLVVSLSRHCVAVVDGVVHDTHDPARGGTRCVYGFYRPGPGC